MNKLKGTQREKIKQIKIEQTHKLHDKNPLDKNPEGSCGSL